MSYVFHHKGEAIEDRERLAAIIADYHLLSYTDKHAAWLALQELTRSVSYDGKPLAPNTARSYLINYVTPLTKSYVTNRNEFSGKKRNIEDNLDALLQMDEPERNPTPEDLAFLSQDSGDPLAAALRKAFH